MALATQSETTTPSLFLALELSKDTWKLGFTTSRAGKVRIRDVPARDLEAFLKEVELAKRHFDLGSDACVHS